MPRPEGYATLGPFLICKKLKDKFKELYKGKVEERVIEMIQKDVTEKVPGWDKEGDSP